MKNMIIVSPIPSHPQFQGNSARIFRLGQMFQSIGFKIYFVYFGMEGLDNSQRIAMENCWDYFYFVQPEGPAAMPSYVDYFDIDDWYDHKVSSIVEKICGRFSIEICLTNYVWFSKVLDALPDSVKKVIDTHDVFGDRHIVAQQAGLDPVWFYTTKELEARALDRADLVIAIQDEEKEYFQSITKSEVDVVGYVVPEHKLIARNICDENKIRIGYIASGNPFNVKSILELQNQIMSYPQLLERFEFVVAGSICSSMKEQNQVFNVYGRVDELEDFYSMIDIAVNPMVGGTGLKIKSLEALSFGKPLIGTEDAMVGIESDSEIQKCVSVERLVQMLLDFDETDYNKLKTDSQSVFKRYNLRHINKFKALFN